MENYWNLHLYVDGDSLPGPLIIGTFEKRAPGPKMGMNFRDLVWKRAWKMTFFGLQ